MDQLGAPVNSWGNEHKESGPEVELVRQMNAGLHELSQPLTALLCALELGASSDCMDELKQLMSGALEECKRLQETVQIMQLQVQQASHRDGPQDSSTPQSGLNRA